MAAPSYQFVTRLTTGIMPMPLQEDPRAISFIVPPLPASFSRDASVYRLRCCFLEHSQDATHEAWAVSPTYWPKGIRVALNKEEHRQPIRLEPSIRSGAKIVVALPGVKIPRQKNGCIYMAAEIIETINHRSARDLLQRIPAEETVRKIQSRLEPIQFGGISIEDNFLRLPLTDPLSLATIKEPVRGTGCKHLECFDLDTWLLSHSGDGTNAYDAWKCPICRMDARPCALRLDEYLAGVREELLDNKGLVHSKWIRVNKQGEWTPVEEIDAGRGVREIIELDDN